MNRMGVWLVALVSASVIAVGGLDAAQGVPASSSAAKTSYVSDTGKSTITSLRVSYAKRGATRLRSNRVVSIIVQTLKMSNDRQGDSDTLLLIFEIKGESVNIDHGSALIARNLTAYPFLGFGVLKPATSNGPAEITLNREGFVSFELRPASKIHGGAEILAFGLPPSSSNLVLKGLEGFSQVTVDLK